jgi:tRNA dimethylallyltransferase
LGDVRDKGRVPVVVGGTGLYLRALLDGLSPAPQRDEDLRTRLREMTERRPASLQRFLRRYDPAAASRIHANDHQKLIRAVELTLLGGQPASVIQSMARTPLDGFQVLKIGLAPERKALYRRIDARAAEMFQAGLVKETQGLRKAGVSPQAKSLQSLGYRQALGVLSGAITVDAAVTECQTKTRQYAKRQVTWFRREPDVHWLEGFGDDREVERAATELTEAFLRVDEIA